MAAILADYIPERFFEWKTLNFDWNLTDVFPNGPIFNNLAFV